MEPIMATNKKNENLKYNIITDEIESKSLDEVIDKLNKSENDNKSLEKLIDSVQIKADYYLYILNHLNQIEILQTEYRKSIRKDM